MIPASLFATASYAEGGRGFAVVMPHVYKHWRVEDLRRCILNGIIWTAKLAVPAAGVQTAAPELTAFAPVSIVPHPFPKQAAAPAVRNVPGQLVTSSP